MTWSTALMDLRTKLSDGDTDRLRAYKRVFGTQDGNNKIFKTLEFKRITNFLTDPAPLGVYVNGTLSPVSADDIATGYFTLVSAPLNADEVTATYYNHLFTDDELEGFLRLACNFLGLGDDYTKIPGGLQNGAVNYAAADGYQKLAMQFADNQSDTYRLEDSPTDNRKDIIASLLKMADMLRSDAIKIRNDYYDNRQGQALAPLFGSNLGCVRDVPPNR